MSVAFNKRRFVVHTQRRSGYRFHRTRDIQCTPAASPARCRQFFNLIKAERTINIQTSAGEEVEEDFYRIATASLAALHGEIKGRKRGEERREEGKKERERGISDRPRGANVADPRFARDRLVRSLAQLFFRRVYIK